MSKTENFKTNYDKLGSIANELKNNSEMDIDVLLTKVKEAIACHKQCKTRLEAATKELDSILQETNADTEEPPVILVADFTDADIPLEDPF